jgi:phenylacetate-CoA ligase
MVSRGKYFIEQIECLPKEDLTKLQTERLKGLFERARERSSFYRDFLEEKGCGDIGIRSLEDLQKIPLMGKKEARGAFPDKLLLVDNQQVREVHATSGTTGKPVYTFATQKDLEVWGERNGRSLWTMGFRPGDSFMICGAYGLASGGLGFHYGGQHINLFVIPTEVGQAQKKVGMIEDLKVTGIGGSPSFIAYMAQIAYENNMQFDKKPYPKAAMFGGEPAAKSTRDKMESLFGIKAYNEYGLGELLGPNMACECERQEGLHVWSDHILAECVDPDSGEWVPEGEEGELVWTFLVSEAMGVIRYRSGDLSAMIPGPCGCGRTHPRIAPIKGRIDDGVSIGGFIVFPSQVEEVLNRFKEAGSNFQLVVDSDQRGLDRFTVNLEVTDKDSLSDEEKSNNLIKKVQEDLRSVLGVTPKEVNLVEPDALPRATDSQAKTATHRVVDRRKKE